MPTPNLDDLSPEGLFAFLQEGDGDAMLTLLAERMFPSEDEDQATVAYCLLRSYARFSRLRIFARLAGNTGDEKAAERQLDRIYQSLPLFARW